MKATVLSSFNANRFFKSFLILAIALNGLMGGKSWGQTIPTAQGIPYTSSFATDFATATTTTLPAGWALHQLSTGLTSSFKTTGGTADRTLLANGSQSNAGNDGMNFTKKIGVLAGGSRVDAPVLALNTTGLKTITVTYTIGTCRVGVAGASGATDVDLQYRAAGDNGSFTSCGGTIYTTYSTATRTTTGDTSVIARQIISVVLPSTCEGLGAIQIRWSSKSNNATTTGNRASWTIDDVSVTGTASVTAPSGLSYTTPQTYTVGTAITTLSPTLTSTGGATVTYSVSPTLPAGLSISSSTGAITGTPTTAVAAADYTVKADNGTGNTTTTVNIKVNATSPSGLSYSTPKTYTAGTAITTLSPTLTSTGGATITYSAVTTLPAGLSISSSTGAITGTPTTASAAANYTIKADNGTGNTTFDVNITVNATSPSGLSYSTPKTYTAGTAITTLSPTLTSTGGASITYSAVTTLPAGLSISSSTGAITGTPTTASAAANYTIKADNGTGNTTFDVNITVNATSPSGLSYSTPQTYTVGTAITTLSPTLTSDGGASITYSAVTTLPAGLSISSSTGAITGTPTTASAASNYTIKATNSAGNTTFDVNIKVNATTPSGLSYASPKTYIVGTAITTLTPTLTSNGGAAVSYSVSPTLPDGLTINTSTGAITGTPTTPSASTDYTVTADNGTASTTATVNITVSAAPLTNQTITFSALSAVTYGDAAFNLTATASSGLTVTYTSSNTSVATVAGNTVTIVGVGSTTITASQAGNGSYNPAPDSAQSLTVNKKALTLSSVVVTTKSYDGNTDAVITGTLNGIVSPDVVTLVGTGTFASANAANGIAVTSTSTLAGANAGNYTLTQPSGLTGNITQASQSISAITSSLSKTYGNASYSVATTATSGLTVTYTSSNTGVATVAADGTVTIVGVGSATITASQAGNTNYSAATSVTQSLTVNKATPTITAAPTASAITYGQTLASSNLTNGTASVAGTFAFTTLSTAPSAGTANQSVTFTPTDLANYSTTTTNVSVTVNKANTSISVAPTASAISYGQTLASSNLSGGTASVAGTFAFTTPSTAPAVGTSSQGVTFTPTDATNYNTASTNVNVTVNQTTTVISFSNFTTPISAGTTITATSNSNATINYSSSNTSVATISSSGVVTKGTVLGTTTITASQNSNTNYTAGTVSQVLTVNNASGSIYTDPISSSSPNSYNPYNATTAGVTDITQNSNITSTGIGLGSGLLGNAGTGRYNAKQWTTTSTAADAISNNTYFEFKLTPNAGYKIDFTSFVYTGTLSSGTPSFFFRSSVDNFASDIGSPVKGGATISLSGTSYQNITSQITFRLYGYGFAASNTTYSINDFTFNGSVNCITPSQPSSISGNSTICSGSPQTYSVTSVSNVGYTWTLPSDWSNSSTSNSITPTVGSNSGNVTVTPFNSNSGCTNYTGTSQTVAVTVNQTPSITPAITATGVCKSALAQNTSLAYSAATNSPTKYSIVWNASPSNSFVALTDATLSATPISISVPANTNAGTYTGTITVKNDSGCVSSTNNFTIKVTAAPNAGTISSANSVCYGQPLTLTSNGDAGGAWSSSATSTATVDANTGVVSTVKAGATVFTYKVTGTGGCSDASTTQNFTVNALPNAGTISGTNSICANSTTTFTSDGDASGTWTSGSTSVATVNQSGVVSPVGITGSSVIKYKVTNTCGSDSSTRTVNISRYLSAGTISGATFIGLGVNTNFSTDGDAGGQWSSSDQTVATINSTSGVVSGVKVGSSDITYLVQGSAPCTSSSATLTVNVSNNGPTITLSDISKTYGDASFALSPSSNSTGTFSYSSSNTNVATISGSTVTIVGAGSAVITVNQSAGGAYTAGSTTANLTVSQKVLTISGPSVTTKVYDGTTAATITGTLTGIISPDVVNLSGTGNFASANAGSGISVTSTSSLTGANASNYSISQPSGLTGDITKANQTITAIASIVIKTYGNAPYSVATTSNSGLTVSYSSSNNSVATVASNGLVTIVGVGTTTITASQAGNANYNAASDVTQSLTVNKSNSTISVAPTASAITYGQALSASILTGGSGNVPGTFVFTSPSSTPNAGTANYSVTFKPTDAANYDTSTTNISVTVNKATPTISVAPTATSIIYGQSLSSSNLSGGTASVAGSFAFTTPSTVPTTTGNQGVTFTPTDNTNYNTATTTVSVTVVLPACSTTTPTALWNFTLGTASVSATVSNLTISDLSQGNNNGTTTLISSTSPSNNTNASGGNNAGANIKNGALSTSTSTYFAFTLTPASGYNFTLTGFSFASRSTGTGPTAYSLRSSIDGYTTDIATGTMVGNSTWVGFSPTTTSTTGLGNATPVTFRLYGYGSSTSAGGAANWRVDDISLTLSVSNAPSTATVGITQNICNSLTSTSLGGNTPAVGTGTWSQVSGPGTSTFSSVNSGSSTATASVVGTYVYRWSITTTCTTVNTADITVNYAISPTANAGNAVETCSNSGAVNITSGATATNNNGTVWTTTNGTGSFANATSLSTATYTPTKADSIAGSITLKLTSTAKTGCTDLSSIKTLTINPAPNATITASAVCANSSKNVATVVSAGTGASYSWSIVNGTIDSFPTINSVNYTSGTTGTTDITVSVTDSKNCMVSSTKKVSINAAPTASIGTNNQTVICTNGTYTVANASVSNNASYSWSTSGNGTFSSTTTLNPTYTPGTTDITNGTVTLTLTATPNSPCIANTTATVLLTFTSGGWTGNYSTDWNDSRNWCGSVPTATSNVTIPASAARMPVLTSNITIKNLTLAGSLLLNGDSLTITGTVSGTGTLKGSSTSTVVMNSSANNTLYFGTGTDSLLKSLVINGTGTTTIGSGLGITSLLSVNSGTLNANGKLGLKSTSIANTAVVGNVTGIVTGKVTVERFIPQGLRAYRQIGAEVANSGSVFANWQEGGVNNNGYGTQITGTGKYNATQGVDPTTGFDYTINNFYTGGSFFTDSNGVWSAGTSYPFYSTIASTKNLYLNPFAGYELLIRGNRTLNLFQIPQPYGMTSNVTLRAKGNLVTGTVSYSTSGITSSVFSTPYRLTSGASAFSFISNPYVAPIDWTSIYNRNKNTWNLTSSYWYLDPTFEFGSIYVVYNAVSQTNSNPDSSRMNQYIQPGQAFFVQNKNTSSAPAFTIQESDKNVTSARTSVFGALAKPNRISIALYKNNRNLDGAVAVFSNAFSTAIDEEDSKKITNSTENIAIVEGGTDLSIDGIANPVANDVVALKLTQMVANTNYELHINTNDFVSNGVSAYLNDKYSNTQTLLSAGANNIAFTATSNAATYQNRFEITFKKTSPLFISSIHVKAQQKAEDVLVNWTVTEETKVTAYEVQTSSNGKEFTTATSVKAKNSGSTSNYSWSDTKAATTTGTHYYRIKTIGMNGEVSYSQVVEVVINNSKGQITIYPNPVKGSTIGLELTNLNKATYTAVMYNNLGQQIISKTIQHNGGSATVTIDLGKQLSAGIYSLKVVGNNGTSFEKEVIAE